MNSIVYLKNGQKAKLISDLGDNKYLINPYSYYEGYYNGDPDIEPSYYEDVSGNLTIVNEFFTKPPKLAIENDFLKIQNEYNELKKSKNDISMEIFSLKNELEKIKKETTDLKKWKIDLSQFKNAKRIIYFTIGKISPCVIEQKDIPKYKSDSWELNIKINFHSGEVTHYSYGYYQHSNDYRKKNYNADKIDYEYGFLFDLTDDEIIEIAKDRCSKMNLEKFSSYDFREDNQKYFAQNAIDRLLELEQIQKTNSINSLKQQIEEDQNKLTLLLSENDIDISTINLSRKPKSK